MTLGGIPGPSLASCPTDKCLTVIVAPWCGVCHSVAPTLVQFRRYLDARSVSSRIVVSLSEPGPIRKFAQEFGSDTLLDDGQQMTARSVPQLLVSDRSGRIVKSVSGFPRISTLDELASYLNLP
jgi:thiol-disulfide isomerase/thioredoxin